MKEFIYFSILLSLTKLSLIPDLVSSSHTLRIYYCIVLFLNLYSWLPPPRNFGITAYLGSWKNNLCNNHAIWLKGLLTALENGWRKTGKENYIQTRVHIYIYRCIHMYIKHLHTHIYTFMHIYYKFRHANTRRYMLIHNIQVYIYIRESKNSTNGKTYAQVISFKLWLWGKTINWWFRVLYNFIQLSNALFARIWNRPFHYEEWLVLKPASFVAIINYTRRPYLRPLHQFISVWVMSECSNFYNSRKVNQCKR